MKKWWLIAGSVLILIIFFFFLKKDEEDRIVETFDKKESNLYEYDGSFFDRVLPEIKKKGLGEVVEKFSFGDHYLTLNTNEQKYHSGVADKIIWVKNRDGVKIDVIEEGFFELIRENGNPFLSSNGDHFIIYYKTHPFYKKTKSKPYIYRVNAKGDLENVSNNLEGVYQGVKKTKNGELVIIEKIYEQTSMYPTALKPYTLHYKMWRNNRWESVAEKAVNPVFDQ